ncbi:selenide, water dikinase SelD [Jannaschia seohaensis]|uniref:Selenide, water dikinase n=1 Tax=Jannaschia seohaensis TaxID=475081 RepID=A0A2Y9ACK4_9RHOB|nr:selenide, water dikinase SelD [Jannaschia seohaensis]PWJ21296.1 selenide,water dikinase [Jannaschia seohaensis]SSA41706.1 selenide, water dikinase [Jannaschia seohaensis]
MSPDLPLTRDLLLIGGGHAHALVLRRWGMDPLPGVRVTVVNPGPTAPYSGMLPGHVAGHYTRDELDIDLVRLARFAGAALIDGEVTGIDPEARTVTIPGRGPLAYDVASLDVGIHAEMPDLPGFAEHAVGAKPLGRFAEAWRGFLARAASGACPPQVAVLGGGVAGAELSLAMAHAMREAGLVPEVTVIEAGPGLSGVGAPASRHLRAAMDRYGVRLLRGARAQRVHADRVSLEEGAAVPAAFVTGAAGARPHPWLAAAPLPLEDGFVRVDSRLRVEGRDGLFAVGDCAHMTHAPRPKAGVYAVRQAPVLHDNLRAALRGMGGLRPYTPQAGYLKLISLGAKEAVAEKAGVTLAGPWLWRQKDRIDRAFMSKLIDLPRMAPPDFPRETARGVREMGQPLCTGCGSKVASDALGAALTRLPAPVRGDVLSGPGDDAAVLAHGTGAQVLTTDHLRAVCADPVLFARIATVHALGDVWAMGAAPQAALASVVLPRMSEALQARSLDQMLGAVAEMLAAEGCDLVGGHSTMGAETMLGLTLTGLSETPILHRGARLGDALILTRPLGTGTVLVAEMAGRARGADVLDMLHAMARPQGDAARLLASAHTMTDVTGFGLAGHLTRLLGPGLGARLSAAALPVYPGALEAMAAGHRSTIHASNARAAPVAGAAGPLLDLLHDPQTAGGLLAAVPEWEAEGLVAQLRDLGHAAARIGSVVERLGLILV